MKYWVDGCASKRHQERGCLAIIHVRGASFCFLISLLFFVFLLFAGYKIWCVVFHRMSTPRSKVGGETLREKRRCLVKGGDKYVTTRKANHPGFLLQTFSSI